MPYSCSFAKSPCSSVRKDLSHLAGAQQAAKGVEAGNYFVAATAEGQVDSRHSYSVAGSIVDREAAVKTGIAKVDITDTVAAAIGAVVIQAVDISAVVIVVVAVGAMEEDTAATAAAISMEAIATAANYTVAIAVVAIAAVATAVEDNCLKEDNCFVEEGFHQRHFHYHL